MKLSFKAKLHKTICNKKGELLIEGVASFVMLLIILGIAMGLVYGSVNMNKKADDITYKTEKSLKDVNSDAGTNASNGKMTINVDGKALKEDIVIKDADDYVYFVPKE